MVEPLEAVPAPGLRRRARSKSRPRALYMEPEIVRPPNPPYQQVSPYQGALSNTPQIVQDDSSNMLTTITGLVEHVNEH